MFVRAALLAALALPASASAAGFAEAPVRVLDYRSSCIQATGTPGELAVGLPDGGVQFLQASRGGFTLGATLAFSRDCATVATRASGAGVAIARDLDLVAAVRDPGGAWSAPAKVLPPDGDWSTANKAVALSDNGHALVASLEQGPPGSVTRLRVTRRAPGGSFGPPEVIATSSQWFDFQVGIADNGDAIVLWWTEEGSTPPIRVPVRVATASAGGTFGAPVQLAEIPWRSTPALAVAPDGHALAVIPDGTSLQVAERPPGEPFGPLSPVAPATDTVGVRTSAAIGSAGRAAIVWEGTAIGRAELLSRATTGAFAAPVTLSPGATASTDPFYASQWYYLRTGLNLYTRTPVTPELTPDGHALFAAPLTSLRNGIRSYGAELVRAPLGASAGERHRPTGGFVFTDQVFGLSLADGAPALAWAEPLAFSLVRLHLATEGAAPPADSSPPRVHVDVPRGHVLGIDRYLKLRVTCSGPCEVRAQVVGAPEDATLRLGRAGHGTLRLYNGARRPFAPLRLGTVRIRVDYGSLNSQQPRTRTLTLRLRRPPDPPVPHAIKLRAVRHRDTIRVTWRTDRPTTRSGSGSTLFWIAGSTARTWTGEPVDVRAKDSKQGGSAFAVTLSRNTSAIRFVTVRANRVGNPRTDEPITVEVR